jgi:hypothetical protein
MSLPIIRQQDAAQVRVLVEDHSEQVVSLSFMPVRGAPDARDARYVQVVFIEQYF